MAVFCYHNFMRKTFFIIPGFKMQAKDKSFSWLVKFLRSKDFDVVKVPVQWSRTTLSQNAVEFKKFYNQNKGSSNYILGFSYGAIIALLTANDLRPKKLFLCSLSPDFREDIKNRKDWISKYIGKNRSIDVLTRSGRNLAKSLSIPTIVFYGEREGRIYPDLKKRCLETAQLARKAKLVIVKNTPHKIDHQAYIEAIKENTE